MRWACRLCREVCPDAVDFLNHVVRHAGVDPADWVCPRCGAIIPAWGRMGRHLEDHLLLDAGATPQKAARGEGKWAR